jgi:uncharacterized protein YjeT (DUF2065 family)
MQKRHFTPDVNFLVHRHAGGGRYHYRLFHSGHSAFAHCPTFQFILVKRDTLYAKADAEVTIGASLTESYMRIRLALVVCSVLLLMGLSPIARPYAWRNGAQEADADLRRSGKVILYTRVANGVAPAFSTPGLDSCDPYRSRVQSWEHFIIIPELTFSEGEMRSLWQSIRASGAFKFAKSYNWVVLKKRGDDVRRFCPEVSLSGN